MPLNDAYARLIETHTPESRVRVDSGGGRFAVPVIADALERRPALADRIDSGEIHAVPGRTGTLAKWIETGGEL